MLRRVVGVFGGLTLASVAGAQSTVRVELPRALAAMRAELVAEIPGERLDARRVTRVTSAPDATIVVADGGDAQLHVFSSAGEFQRIIGRRGSGPSEFQSISALGWLGDTLVVLDAQQRRLSMFAVASGAFLGTIPWSTDREFGAPVGLLAARTGLYVVIRRNDGERSLNALGGMVQPVAYYAAPLTARGASEPPAHWKDARATPVGTDCEAPGGIIRMFGAFFPDRGDMRAISGTGEFVLAARDSVHFTLIPASPTAPRTTMVLPSTAVPVADAVWDSVAKPYLAFARERGTPKCSGEKLRPDVMPSIRAMQVDDLGRIWIERNTNGRADVRAYTSAGAGVGTFALPPRDESVPWWIRGGRIHVVVTDADGLQSVRVLSIRLRSP